ncbi:tetratricopeptide repeat protein [Rhodovulum steppense]|uniref:TPR repeat protein n=1 Tax=Rhodovulum steppense TaxID=540251 RepID=A0A4R1YY30_9RHOB|nr:tetratricopeptide repeat protein [Rhodovulum steppense]TCM86108.1 TPR repeat protein [Rhodovulum steppense]
MAYRSVRGMALAGSLLAGFALGPGALAQGDVAAVPGDAAGARVIGEALVTGTDGLRQDVAEGLRLLEEAAAGGDVAARASLGKMLLDGIVVPADPARARALLTTAAEAGDVDAMRVLGDNLVGGWTLERDAMAGRAWLDRAIAAGDVDARIALGGFLLYGIGLDTDPEAALVQFEAAAEAGNGAGLESYGEWLMWTRRGPSRAEAYLRRAAEMGQAGAWTKLAEGAMYGYLGADSRSKFPAFAERARAVGQDRVAVLEAERQMWGISMRANGPAALAMLDEAVERGNAEALKALVALKRDGNGMNVRRDQAGAREALDRYGELLTPTEAAQLGLSLRVAEARTPQDFAPLAEALGMVGPLRSTWFAGQLNAANPNFAIYLLQKRMRDEGLYAGPLDGVATRETLRAMFQACHMLPDTSGCADSVMNPRVIAALLTR